jgi:hypothetical protein
MLYREIIAFCSQIYKKHINTVCGQNVGFVNVHLGGKYSYHRVLPVLQLIVLLPVPIAVCYQHLTVGQAVIFLLCNSKLPAVNQTVQEY